MGQRPGLFIPSSVLWTVAIGSVGAALAALLAFNATVKTLETQMTLTHARLDRLEALIIDGGLR